MADLFPSRAQSIGVKPKVLLARTQKSLSHYRAALTEFAAPYVDIDNSVQGALDDLMAAFDDFERHVRETVTWLNAQPGTCPPNPQSRSIPMNPAFDNVDEEIKQIRLEAWHKAPGPRVGDFIQFPTGGLRRIAHVWPDRIQPTSGTGSFYFGHGYCSHSGGLDSGIAREIFIDTGRTKPGEVWFFHHDSACAQNGVTTTIPCRVYALQTQH